jgi:SAM-dependent methyltransferase
MSNNYKRPTENSEIKNFFGLTIHEIREIIKDLEIEVVIHSMRENIFRYLGIHDEKSEEVMAECLEFARICETVQEYELFANVTLRLERVAEAIPSKLSERADIMYQQIKEHLFPGSVLDLGCGDARLAQLLEQNGFILQLADVYKDPNVVNSKMPFELIRQNKAIPFNDNQFDNTLLLTVLHHSDNPVQVLNEARRVTRPNGRIIVIESVYGVTGKELSDNEYAKAGGYLLLNSEQQRMINIFFDHFYNRVIHYTENPDEKINVPYNFNTPGNWKVIFEQNSLIQSGIRHLGADQPLVPEYHTLHILDVRKDGGL